MVWRYWYEQEVSVWMTRRFLQANGAAPPISAPGPGLEPAARGRRAGRAGARRPGACGAGRAGAHPAGAAAPGARPRSARPRSAGPAAPSRRHGRGAGESRRGRGCGPPGRPEGRFPGHSRRSACEEARCGRAAARCGDAAGGVVGESRVRFLLGVSPSFWRRSGVSLLCRRDWVDAFQPWLLRRSGMKCSSGCGALSFCVFLS